MFKLLHEYFSPRIRRTASARSLPFAALALCSLGTSSAHAYIGPGLGLGVAATVVGIVCALVLLVIGLVWLPIRRWLRARKLARQPQEAVDGR